VATANEIVLVAADLEAAARMPPEQLVAMRLIVNAEAVEEKWLWLVKLRDENPRAFMKDLLQAEKEWRETVAKLEPAKVQAADGGTERGLELIGRALDGKVGEVE